MLSTRSDDPTASSPLTYREVALAVASTTSTEDAVALARSEFDRVIGSLRATPTGKFIQIAVFDHTFEAKPQRPPIVVVSFKDWRSSEPDFRFPLRDGPSARMSLAPHEGGAMSMRPAPPPESAAIESPPASSRKVPAPRPSQLKRDAADMVGDDEPTLLRPEIGRASWWDRVSTPV